MNPVVETASRGRVRRRRPSRRLPSFGLQWDVQPSTRTLSISLLVLAACLPEVSADLSLVDAPRILAVAAEPAELEPGKLATFTELYADADTIAAVALDRAVCTARRPLAELGPVDPACIARTSDELVALPCGPHRPRTRRPRDRKREPMDRPRRTGPRHPVGGDPRRSRRRRLADRPPHCRGAMSDPCCTRGGSVLARRPRAPALSGPRVSASVEICQVHRIPRIEAP